MPISSFYGLQTSLRGLLAQQRSLDTTGHNIANANTPGYSRQEAVLAASEAFNIPSGGIQSGAGAHIGSGVDVQSYRRVRDQFLDLQYRAQNTRLGEESAKADGLDRAELALAEPSEDGISSQLAKFWDAWSDVANDPDGAAARQALVEQAGTLAEAFETVDSQIKLVSDQSKAQFDALMKPGGEVEETAKQIAQLNDTIKRFVTAGDVPNDLMDQRDQLLDKLSGLAQISVESLDTGSVKVTFGGPGDTPLVDDTAVNFPPPLSAPGGQLGALKDLSATPGGTLDGYRQQLNTVVKTIADSVNAIHGTSPAFFTYTAGAEASSLTVAITPATLKAGTSSEKGANDIALKIGELRGKTGDSAYQAFVAKMGTDVAAAKTQEANAQALTDSVEDRRQSVAGVSLDEEMTNLIRFQRGYQASSRAMSTMDEMLDVLINRTGRVGL